MTALAAKSCLAICLILICSSAIALQVGCFAPTIDLPDHNREQYALDDFRKHWRLLFFYPQTDTAGCTT